MTKIQNLKIKNYRSIRDIDLPLNDLNILIGRNGVGKSNFVNFFSLLKDAMNENLAKSINDIGGMQQAIYYNSRDRIFEWEIKFSDLKSVLATNDIESIRGIGYYHVRIMERKPGGFAIQFEEVERPPYQNFQGDTRYKYLSVINGIVRLLKYKDEDEDQEVYEESDQELIIAQVRNKNRYPVLKEINDILSDWVIFRGFGNEVLANIRTPQLFSTTEKKLRLDADGRNLISVLHQLRNEPKYHETNAQLDEVMRTALPDFVQFDLPIIGGGYGSLNYRSKNYPNISIPAISMSDGQLRFLGLAILLLLPDPPELIALDEPEIGLHPELLSLLAGLLKAASKRTQIIVTTHSPQILNSDAIEASDVILVENKEDGTTFERPRPDYLERWLRHYSLGDLWTRGTLETVGR